MSRFKYVLPVAVFFLCYSVTAQDYKFGKVSKEELLEKVYAQDSAAAAAVLYRKRNIRYNYVQGSGFQVITEVHERVKIYTKEGFRYATVSERLYKNNRANETIAGLKAFTYTMENGDVEKQKMGKSAIFSTSLNKYRNEEKFTLPNLKEGSVIEYEYRIVSPFAYNIDEIVLQYDIPIKKQEISIATPEYFMFKPNMKGYLGMQPKYTTNSGKINFSSKTRSTVGQVSQTTFKQNEIDYTTNVTSYNMDNVPALKEEPFVNDIDNYRSAVKYELQYVQFPQSIREGYTTSWEKVIEKIYDNSSFGTQLKIHNYYKDDLELIKAKTSSKVELVAAIFSHVQRRMTWNSIYGYFVDKGVKEAYKEKSGNIADINLMLTSMLQQAGLEAYPVLVSTRSHGIPLFPTREGFNYVIASVQLDGNTILLDATNKFSEPNLLPTRALNWYGKLIKKDGTFTTLNLIPEKPSRNSFNMSVSLNEDGSLEGKMRKTYGDYNAYLHRNKYSSINEDEYLEKLENKNDGMEISDYTVKNKNALGKPISESYAFSMENQASTIGDKIYFSPLFHLAMEKNPFKLEKRNYPIDFTYPWQERNVILISLPEGYETTSLPEGVNLVMADGMGGFRYQISLKGKILQVLVDFKINRAIISPEYYQDLKEFFKKAIEKQTEKVVLSKISSDGTSQSAAGGR